MASASVNQGVLAGRVVLYDGLCNLCNGGIKFVAKRDPNKNIMFCSIQSHAADPYLVAIGMTRQQALKRFVFVEYKDWSVASTAALRVATHMQQPWPLARALTVVPVPLRDAVYDYVAKNRYKWFGRTEVCQVPDSSIIERFVDRNELLAGWCRKDAMPEEDEEESKK